MANRSLNTGRINKNDEFYTRADDIWKELKYYKKHFKGKVVLCNCDDPMESEFFIYFKDNFTKLGLKKLISTHYKDEGSTYKLEITGDINLDGRINFDDIIKTTLEGNGDFKSDECIKILKEADIVVTNPPFSLFRDYITQLVNYNKKYLIIAPDTIIKHHVVFPLIKENKLWKGRTNPSIFDQPDGTIKKFGNIGWLTNLENKQFKDDLILFKEYNKEDHPKYDEFDAIFIDRVKNIPKDYDGIIAAPGGILSYNYENDFELLNVTDQIKRQKFQINGQNKYTRFLIKKIKK